MLGPSNGVLGSTITTTTTNGFRACFWFGWLGWRGMWELRFGEAEVLNLVVFVDAYLIKPDNDSLGRRPGRCFSAILIIY